MVHIDFLRRKAFHELKKKAKVDVNANTKLWVGYIIAAPPTIHRPDGVASISSAAVDEEFTTLTSDLLAPLPHQPGRPRLLLKSKSSISNVGTSPFRRCANLISDESVKTKLAEHLEMLTLRYADDVVSKVYYLSCMLCLQERVSSEVITAVCDELVTYIRSNPDSLQTNSRLRRRLMHFLETSQNARITMDSLVELLVEHIDATNDVKFNKLVTLLRLVCICTENCTGLSKLVQLIVDRVKAGDPITLRVNSLIRYKLTSGTNHSLDFVVPLTPLIAACLEKFEDRELARGIASAIRRLSPRQTKMVASHESLIRSATIANDIMAKDPNVLIMRIPLLGFLHPRLETLGAELVTEILNVVSKEDHVGIATPQALHHVLRVVTTADKMGIDKDLIQKALINVAELVSRRDHIMSYAVFFTFLVRSRRHIKSPDAVKTAISRIPDISTVKHVEFLAALLVVIPDVPDSMNLMYRISLALGRLPIPPESAGLVIDAYTSALSMGVPARRLTKTVRDICLDVTKSPNKYPPREVNGLLRRFPVLFKLNSKYLLENTFHIHVARNASGVVSVLYSEMAKRGATFTANKPAVAGMDGPEEDTVDTDGLLRRNITTEGLPALAAILAERPRMWLALRSYVALARYLVPGKLTRRRQRGIMAFLEVNRDYWNLTSSNLYQFSQICSSATHKLRATKTTRIVKKKMATAIRPLLSFYVSVVSQAIDSGLIHEVEKKDAFWSMAAGIASHPSIRNMGGSTRTDVRKIFLHAIDNLNFKDIPPFLVSQMYATSVELDDLELRQRLTEIVVDLVDEMPYNTLNNVSTTLQLLLEPRSKLLLELNSVM